MTQEGRLQASPNLDRYAGEGTGGDLTSGNCCEIWLGGHWIAGCIELTGRLYVDESSWRA